MKTTTDLKNLLMAAPMLLLLLFTSCSTDHNEIELLLPTISNIEIGLSNNEIGVIGRDFHLNAKIIAGDKLDLVQVTFEPIEGESYAGSWDYKLSWNEFKGLKNATVHKHFDIPEDAVEGKYNFTIIVNDENGTTLKEKRSITIYKAENLPVDPQIRSYLVVNKSTNRQLFNYSKDGSGDRLLKMNDTLTAQAYINNVKGDGKLYVVLINKKHNHKPEYIDAIDYTKTIIWDIEEHTGLETSQTFGNTVLDFSTTPLTMTTADLLIGAERDNNLPNPNPITGLKAWEDGTYYLGLLYQNTTYNMSLFYYIEVSLSM